MPYSPDKNLGRPHLLEEGQDIELGQPVIDESQKEVELKFQGYGLLIEDALQEFTSYLSKKSEVLNKRQVEEILKELREDLKGKERDVILPLALVEAVELALEKIERRVEDKKEEGDIPDETDRDNAEMAQLYKKSYQEAEDFFFSHSELFDAMPDYADMVEWLKNEKKYIEIGAGDKGINEARRKHCESRLKAEVPAINNFIEGRVVKSDLDVILSILDEKILSAREEIIILLKLYFQGTGKGEAKEEIEGQLRFIYIVRSFMALIEGERNERVALHR